MKGPCKDCPDRHPACHDQCEKYRKWLDAYHADQRDIQRLKEIREKIDTPLVLHGGSGLPVGDLHACIENGITKVNIFTDLYVAGKAAMADQSGDYHVIRTRKVQAIKEVVMEKIKLFGSDGKA